MVLLHKTVIFYHLKLSKEWNVFAHTIHSWNYIKETRPSRHYLGDTMDSQYQTMEQCLCSISMHIRCPAMSQMKQTNLLKIN